MQTNITREEAWALLNEYNKDEFHLEHGEIVEKIPEDAIIERLLQEIRILKERM